MSGDGLYAWVERPPPPILNAGGGSCRRTDEPDRTATSLRAATPQSATRQDQYPSGQHTAAEPIDTAVGQMKPRGQVMAMAQTGPLEWAVSAADRGRLRGQWRAGLRYRAEIPVPTIRCPRTDGSDAACRSRADRIEASIAERAWLAADGASTDPAMIHLVGMGRVPATCRSCHRGLRGPIRGEAPPPIAPVVAAITTFVPDAGL